MKNLNTHFTSRQCKSLFDAILANDKIKLEAKLPDKITFNYSLEQFEQCYLISLQLWKEGVDRRSLKSLILNIFNNASCTPAEAQIYKHIRAKFKHLRFCFVICGDEHTYPNLFNRLTIKMGKFQDAFKGEKYSSIRKLIFQLSFYLNYFIFRKIRKEINEFNACNTEGFTLYIKREIEFIQIHLKKDKIASKDFHEMRKVISRQLALFQTLKVLYPSQYHNEISTYLSTINGMMGALHDELILDKFVDESSYYQETLLMPSDIKNRLIVYTQKFSHTL